MEWTVFGERLSKELEKKQLSYRQFAEKVGMTTTTVFRYAKCERVPRANEIIKTAKALGVTCDYLLGLSDDPHKTSMSYVIAQPEIIRCGGCVNFAERDFCKVAGHNVHRKSNCMQVFGAERRTDADD